MSRPWLSDDEVALLQAALTEGDEAARRWHRFTSRVDLEEIWDGERFSLLPAVHLALDGVDDLADAPRLAGIHRRTWVANQSALARCVEVISTLGDTDVRACLHSDLAVATTRCDDLGARVVGDGEVLIDAAQLAPALAVLARAGWQPVGVGSAGSLSAHIDGIVVVGGGDQTRVRLVWETCRGVARSGADRASVGDVIDGAVPVVTDHGQVPVAAPHVLATHALCAGVGSLPDRRLRSLWDSARMLSPSSAARLSAADLAQVVDRIERLGVAPAAAHTLGAVGAVTEGLGLPGADDGTGDPAPDDLRVAVEALRVPGPDRWRHRVLVATAGNRRRLPHLRAARARQAMGMTSAEAFCAAPGFLRARWGLGSTGALPGAAVRKASRATIAALAHRAGTRP